MSRAIWKCKLDITDQQQIRLPADAQILCVQMQRGQPCLWAMVNTDESEFAARHIRIIGTGNPIDKQMTNEIYIGTFQQFAGALVWHVFEEC